MSAPFSLHAFAAKPNMSSKGHLHKVFIYNLGCFKPRHLKVAEEMNSSLLLKGFKVILYGTSANAIDRPIILFWLSSVTVFR